MMSVNRSGGSDGWVTVVVILISTNHFVTSATIAIAILTLVVMVRIVVVVVIVVRMMVMAVCCAHGVEQTIFGAQICIEKD